MLPSVLPNAGIYYHTSEDQTVVTWLDALFMSGDFTESNAVSFQIALSPDGGVQMR